MLIAWPVLGDAGVRQKGVRDYSSSFTRGSLECYPEGGELWRRCVDDSAALALEGLDNESKQRLSIARTDPVSSRVRRWFLEVYDVSASARASRERTDLSARTSASDGTGQEIPRLVVSVIAPQ